MSDDEAFLTAILNDPEDVTVRLVYADYLQERGEETRARLIRDAEEDRWPAFCAAWLSLRDELGRLTGLSGGSPGQWGNVSRTPYLQFSWQGRDRVTLTFRHGFVEGVECSVAAWRQIANALLSAHPVRLVVLTDVSATELVAAEREWPGVYFEPSSLPSHAVSSNVQTEPTTPDPPA